MAASENMWLFPAIGIRRIVYELTRADSKIDNRNVKKITFILLTAQVTDLYFT